MARAQVGVEGEGDVDDPALRRTREQVASELGLDSCFAFLETHEKLVHQVHDVLCPTAEKIGFKPYKLLVYGPGDFFTVHVDTMHHPSQIGSLALEVPLEDEAMSGPDFDEKMVVRPSVVVVTKKVGDHIGG